MPLRLSSSAISTLAHASRFAVLATAAACSSSAAESVALDRVEVSARSAAVEAPAAVTLYPGEFLAALGVTDYQGLAPLVPGFFVSAQTVENVSLNLRGLTSDTNDPRQQPRVAVFQDGVALNNSHGNSVALFDLAEVAAFKGPQPARFGTGVESGAIALTSQRATGASSSLLSLGWGERRAASLEAVVNRPLVADRLLARVAVYAEHRDGYAVNPVDGSDLQGVDTIATRASLRAQPTAGTTADVIFNYQRDRTPGLAAKSMRGLGPVPGAVELASPYVASLNRGSELGVERTILSLAANFTRKLDPAWTLSALGAWRDVATNHEFDADGTPLYLLEGGEGYRGRQLSAELRLAHQDSGPLTGSVGAALWATRDRQLITIRSDENILWTYLTGAPPPIAFNPRYREQAANQASATVGEVFAEADYKLTSRLTLGGELRLTQERLTSRFQSYPAPQRGSLAGIFPASGGGNNILRPTNGRREARDNFGSWSGGVHARQSLTTQLSAYAAVSRGRRRPILDFNDFTQAPQLHAEEHVWNYEVGLKGATADRRVRYDASVFRYDFDRFQTQRVAGPGIVENFDGGRARGQGFEGSVQAAPTGTWTAFATYGYTDARFAARDADGRPQLYAGNTFRLTSRHTGSIGGTLPYALAGRGTLFLTPLLTYRSALYFEDNHALSGGILRQGGYSLVNLRLGYRTRDNRWEITSELTNLLGKDYLLDAGNVGAAYGFPTSTPAAPRHAGVKVTMRW